MERTTLSSYPNLITVKPIKGTVYKVTQITHPHPKITVMSYEEVQMHQKCEATATTLGEKTRRNIFKRKMKAQKGKDMDARSSFPSRCENPHSSQKTPPKENLWRKTKNRIKKMFAPLVTKPLPRESHLALGFHCASSTCSACTPPPVVPRALELSLHALSTPFATTTMPVTSTTSSFSSGFTTSTCSTSSSTSLELPRIEIPPAREDTEVSPTASAMHDIFADFSGVYCADTPALQLAPLRPVSPFVEGTVLSSPSTLSLPLTSTPLPVLQVSTPYTLSMPRRTSTPPTPFLSSGAEESSPDGSWPTRHLDTPCPTHRQSAWSFDLVAPDSAFVAVKNAGDVARHARGWKGTVWVEGDGEE